MALPPASKVELLLYDGPRKGTASVQSMSENQGVPQIDQLGSEILYDIFFPGKRESGSHCACKVKNNLLGLAQPVGSSLPATLAIFSG